MPTMEKGYDKTKQSTDHYAENVVAESIIDVISGLRRPLAYYFQVANWKTPKSFHIS